MSDPYEPLRGNFACALAEYGKVPPKTPLTDGHPISLAFHALQRQLATSWPVTQRPTLEIAWSAGKGGKSKVPWVALLDRRVTKSTRTGVYGVYLFRQDLSGVYLALGLGAAGTVGRFYDVSRRDRRDLQARAMRLQPFCHELASRGFSTEQAIDLRTDSKLGRGYEAGTIAHRLYTVEALPEDRVLLDDLGALLSAYDKYIDEEVLRSSPIARAEVSSGTDIEPLHTPITDLPSSQLSSVPAAITLATASGAESPDDLGAAYRRHQDDLEMRLLERIKAMRSDYFERFATHALQALGFVDMLTTRQSGDGGIDATGTFTLGVGRVRAAAQFKRWQGNIGRPLVDQFRGALIGRYELGVFITTSDFARNVLEDPEGRVVPILLLNGKALVRRLIESRTAVRTVETLEILDLDEEWLEQFRTQTDSPEAAMVVRSAASGGPQRRARLGDLLAGGVLAAPATLRIRVGGRDIQGELTASGDIVTGGRSFSTPSAAAKYATGLSATDGWVYWECLDPTSGDWVRLEELRTRLDSPLPNRTGARTVR